MCQAKSANFETTKYCRPCFTLRLSSGLNARGQLWAVGHIVGLTMPQRWRTICSGVQNHIPCMSGSGSYSKTGHQHESSYDVRKAALDQIKLSGEYMSFFRAKSAPAGSCGRGTVRCDTGLVAVLDFWQALQSQQALFSAQGRKLNCEAPLSGTHGVASMDAL